MQRLLLGIRRLEMAIKAAVINYGFIANAVLTTEEAVQATK